MHFFVARLFSIAVITQTYVNHIRNLSPMNRLRADLIYMQRINFSYAKAHATAAHALRNLRATTLSFDASFPENHREYPYKPYIARN